MSSLSRALNDILRKDFTMVLFVWNFYRLTSQLNFLDSIFFLLGICVTACVIWINGGVTPTLSLEYPTDVDMVYRLMWSFIVISFYLCCAWLICIHSYRTFVNNQRGVPASVMIILGSGGHTTEMLKTIAPCLPPGLFQPRIYISSNNDNLSQRSALQMERNLQLKSQFRAVYYFDTVSRARNVGQSWFSSFFTTLKAIFDSFVLLLKWKPDLIVCNGPGVCVPLILVSRLYRALGISKSETIFFESICRCDNLSLTGHIMRFIAHDCIVSSLDLARKYNLTHIGAK